jgi:hypothetical protein
MMSATTIMMRAALAYAQPFEFAAFPVAPHSKIPASEHGCLDATRDRDRIREWWKGRPDANIGIATGDGFVVLDVDFDGGGAESLAALEAQHEPLPHAPTVETPGPGLHIYLRVPRSIEIRNSAGVLGRGLDIRGRGGYVVAPPSIHPNGGRYVWKSSAHIKNIVLPDAPDWLLRLISSPGAQCETCNHTRYLSTVHGESLGNRVDVAQMLAGVPEGQRDSQLFRLALSLRRRGHSREFVEDVVVEIARRCRPPFPDRQALRKVQSAWRYS